MKRFFFIFVCICYCVAQSPESDGFQSWVSDPRFSFFPTLPNVAPLSQDEKCRSQSETFLKHLENKTLWAVQMWDSSAKSPVGVISGSVYHFGNYDECLRVAAPFDVQFCIAHVFANISAKFWDFRLTEKISPEANAWSYISRSRFDVSKVPRDVLGWGLCVPAACNNADIELAINYHLMSYAKRYNNDTIFGAMVFDKFCTPKNNYIEFTVGEIAFWVFFFSLILLTSSSTLMDLIPNREGVKQTKLKRLWMFFSVKQNIGHLFPFEKETKSPLSVFHGIKFVSILFILYGHRVGMNISLSTMNYDEIENYLIDDHKMFFVHTDLVVDTFFFISGLLACYIMVDILSRNFISPIYPIIVRISRLAPLYFFVIWFQSTAAFRMGSGPLWNEIGRNETDYCVDHWWSNVFFFSNYYKTDEMCLPHSWFLPCELHFFILASFLVPIILKYPTFGRTLLGIVTVISAIIPSVVIYMYKIQPLILFYFEFLTQPRKYDSFNKLYIKSHNRATVYLIGMAVALFLHHTKDSKKRISKKLTFCGILAWWGFLFAPMAYGSLYYNPDKSYNVIEAAIFGSVRRISWAIGLSFFIITHRFGKIPLADLFFSSKLAVFCSRITYGIYLIHFTLITTDILKTRSARVFSVHDVVVEGLGDIFKSVIVTLLLLFILEIPLKRILREFIFIKQVKAFEKPQEVQNVLTVRL